MSYKERASSMGFVDKWLDCVRGTTVLDNPIRVLTDSEQVEQDRLDAIKLREEEAERRGEKVAWAMRFGNLKQAAQDILNIPRAIGRNKVKTVTAAAAVMPGMNALTPDRAVIQQMDGTQTEQFLNSDLSPLRIGKVDPKGVDITGKISLSTEALSPENSEYAGYDVPFSSIKDLVSGPNGEAITTLPAQGLKLAVNDGNAESFRVNFLDKLADRNAAQAILDQVKSHLNDPNYPGVFSLQLDVLPGLSAENVTLLPLIIFEKKVSIQSGQDVIPITPGSVVINGPKGMEMLLIKKRTDSIITPVRAKIVLPLIQKELIDGGEPVPGPETWSLVESRPIPASAGPQYAGKSEIVQIGDKTGAAFPFESISDHPPTVTPNPNVPPTGTPSPEPQLMSTPKAPVEVGFAKLAAKPEANFLGYINETGKQLISDESVRRQTGNEIIIDSNSWDQTAANKTPKEMVINDVDRFNTFRVAWYWYFAKENGFYVDGKLIPKGAVPSSLDAFLNTIKGIQAKGNRVSIMTFTQDIDTREPVLKEFDLGKITCEGTFSNDTLKCTIEGGFQTKRIVSSTHFKGGALPFKSGSTSAPLSVGIFSSESDPNSLIIEALVPPQMIAVNPQTGIAYSGNLITEIIAGDLWMLKPQSFLQGIMSHTIKDVYSSPDGQLSFDGTPAVKTLYDKIYFNSDSAGKPHPIVESVFSQ